MARRMLTMDGAFCSNCGNAAEAGAEMCFSCGQPFEGDVPGTKCPQCGRALEEGRAACPVCGTALPRAAKEPVPSARELIAEIKAFREEGRSETTRLPHVPSAVPEESEAAFLAELESLWKLSEPFEQVVSARRKRLGQMDRLIAAARRRVRELEESNQPTEAREREELKRQVQEVLLERDEILKIEYGITEMERIYRNIITMQQKELRAKEDSLKARLEGFRKELGMRDEERKALVDRERELEERERALQAQIADFEARRRGAAGTTGPQASEPPPEAEGVSRDQWLAAQKEIQEALLKLRGTEGEIVLPTAANVRDLKVRATELEEQIEKTSEEKSTLEEEIAALREAEGHVREVLKEVDELLGSLPDPVIKKFARSDAFKKYEQLMERLGL